METGTEGFSRVPLSQVKVGDKIRPMGWSKPYTVSGIIHELDGTVAFTNHNKKGERVKGWAVVLTATATLDSWTVLRKDI